MKERISRISNILTSQEIRILPGNLAYSFFLAIIPIISLLFYFLTSFNLPMNTIQNFLVKTFPSNVVEFLQPVFTSELTGGSVLTIVLSLVVMTNGCNAIILASNTIFHFENSSFLKRMIKSLVLTIILILLIAFIMIVPLFGRSIINLIGMFTDFISINRENIDALYTILQIPVSLLIMFYIIKLVYVIAPDEKVSSKYMNKGAFFTTISWLIVTIGYSYYINNIARYDLVYGNLANIVILLFWFYVLAYIFVIGLYLNKNKAEAGIEKTNRIKLDEIRKKIREEQNKK